jgi:hypothetical protein
VAARLAIDRAATSPVDLWNMLLVMASFLVIRIETSPVGLSGSRARTDLKVPAALFAGELSTRDGSAAKGKDQIPIPQT